MATKMSQYARPETPKTEAPEENEETQPPKTLPPGASLKLRDLFRSFMGGAGQGLAGSRRTWEQWLRSKSPSQRYTPKRRVLTPWRRSSTESWLSRILRTKNFR